MSESDSRHDQPTTVSVDSGRLESGNALAPGSIILERYKVLGLLGKGGMGSVFHVKHLHLQSEFALKVLNHLADGTVWKRFENEAKAASRLDHPNLIKVHDSGLLSDGQPFFIMEMVDGETLSDMVRKNGRIPLLKTLKIFIQVGFALAYAHENGVIHRDLKPSNIMIARKQDGSLIGSVKVLDLGIAKLTGIDEFNQQTLTRTGEIFGSPLYMSPEQCIGVSVDNRSDLYSLGCSMYEALTGAPPFVGDNALSTMMKHQSEKPLALREASMGIQFPAAVEELVAKLLEKDPINRYANAQLLTHALVQVEQTLNESGDLEKDTDSVRALVPPQKKTSLRIWKKENLKLLAMTAIAFIIGFATSRFSQPQSQSAAADKKPTSEESEPFAHLIPRKEDQARSAEISEKNLGPLSTLSPDGKTRLFNFPTYSLGKILIPRNPINQAKGTVTVPSEYEIYFEPKAVYLRSPDLLNRFAEDDITQLTLQDKILTDTSVFTALPRFKRLRSLKISMDVGNEVIPLIDEIPNLDALHIDNIRITGDKVAQLKRFPKLYSLSCSNISMIKPILHGLTGTKIQELRVDNDNLSADDLRQIAKQTRLISLSISGNEKIDDEALKELIPLKNLRYLFAAGCQITDKSVDTLKHFKNLELLLVSAMSPAQMAAFRKELKGVKVCQDQNGEDFWKER